MRLLVDLIAGGALAVAIWHWWTTRDQPEADARDPNVRAFKRDYPARATWRNGAPRKPAA